MPKKRILFIGAILLAIVIGTLYFVYVSEFMKIDRCLDAGGRWNYELKECELRR